MWKLKYDEVVCREHVVGSPLSSLEGGQLPLVTFHHQSTPASRNSRGGQCLTEHMQASKQALATRAHGHIRRLVQISDENFAGKQLIMFVDLIGLEKCPCGVGCSWATLLTFKLER